MVTSNEERLRELFDRACGMKPEQRSTYLSIECSDNADLQQQVEALLACDGTPHEILDTSLLKDNAKNILTESNIKNWQLQIPTTLGQYRVIREIGFGSMGIVFEARHNSTNQKVAIKILRPGVSTKKMIRRFLFEADALKRLDHPGVARFLDAGTTDTGFGPQPYFAMELIQGKSLCEYANKNNLSIPQRLALLARICDAVQHAHTRGIIHRDLKPGNIIVEDTDQPKILDFGIARSIVNEILPQTANTVTGQFIGTLQYMSPEQASGHPDEVDTRCDIYTLGVLGYELLCGRLPHQLNDLPLLEAMRVITQSYPSKLGLMDQAFKGDIETIFTKAMDKEKDRRYQSVSDLAGDIRRFLNHEPISARPPSIRYQLNRFAKRNKGVFAGSMVALFALILGVLGTGYGYIKAVEQQRLAEAREHEVEISRTESKAVADLLINILSSASPEEKGKDVLLTDILYDISNMIDHDLADQPLAAARLNHTLAKTYKNLGNYTLAQKYLEEAIAGWQTTLGDEHPSIVKAQSNLAMMHQLLGQFDKAEKLYIDILQIHRRVFGEDHKNTLITTGNLASLYSSQGHYEEARALYQSTIKKCREMHGDEHDAVLSMTNNLALLFSKVEKYEEAELLFTQLIEIHHRIHGRNHPQSLNAVNNLAYTYAKQGNYNKAEPLFCDTLEVQRRILGENHPKTMGTMGNLAVIYQNQGRFEEAASLYRNTIELEKRRLGDDHPKTIGSMFNLATLYHKLEHDEKAEPVFVRVLDARQRVLGDTHHDTIAVMNELAVLYRSQQRYEEAQPLFKQAITNAREKLGTDHQLTLKIQNNIAVLHQALKHFEQAEQLYKKTLEARMNKLGHHHRDTIVSQLNLADLYNKWDRYSEAVDLLDHALNSAEKSLPSNHWITGVLLQKMGKGFVGQARYKEGEKALLESYQILTIGLGTNHTRTKSTAKCLANLYDTIGNPQAAAEWLTKSQAPAPHQASGQRQ